MASQLKREASIEAHERGHYSARVKAWVERSCAEQGVPVKTSDPLALARSRKSSARLATVRPRARGNSVWAGQCSGMTPEWRLDY
jgi:hypothetical protein